MSKLTVSWDPKTGERTLLLNKTQRRQLQEAIDLCRAASTMLGAETALEPQELLDRADGTGPESAQTHTEQPAPGEQG